MARVMEVSGVQVRILKSNPPQLAIDVKGHVNSTGWTGARLEPWFYTGGTPPDGILRFDFVGVPPQDKVNFAITEITASTTIEHAPNIKGVRVHSTTNAMETSLGSNGGKAVPNIATHSGGREIQVPTALTGFLTRTMAGMCMDGATHVIHTATGASRLKGRNVEAVGALTKYEDGATRMTVIGYPTWGPECTYVSIYSLWPAEEMMGLMDDRFIPFPFSKKAVDH